MKLLSKKEWLAITLRCNSLFSKNKSNFNVSNKFVATMSKSSEPSFLLKKNKQSLLSNIRRSMFIQTFDTPNPNSLKFMPGIDVLGEGSVDFPDWSHSHKSPLAKRLFSIEGVSTLFVFFLFRIFSTKYFCFVFVFFINIH